MKKKKVKDTLTDDPNRQSEQTRYKTPVASRDYIRQVLEDHGAPMGFEKLVTWFELQEQPEQHEALRRRISAMIRDGQLIRNRKGDLLPVDESDLVSGRISAHPDGFGFLVVESGTDIYLSGKQMRRVLHGDRVVVCITGLDRRGRREGRIVEVIERGNQQIVGRFMSEQGVYFIAPDNRRIHQDLLIPDQARNGAKSGDMVIAEIVEQPTNKHGPVGKVIDVLGQHLKAGMETDVAIASHGIPHEWSVEVEKSIKGFDGVVSEEDKVGRKDVRKLPLVTIDGEDARDFDDAVYCEKREGGWRLFVAIADVSHYVLPDAPLDKSARERGTSVYFPSRVVPMLPEVLSNGLCSLNPDVDRLCMLCEMTLDETGAVKRTRFYKGLMRSHARLTYTQVGNMLEQKDASLRKQFQALVPHLENLHDLYKVLVKGRKKRGSIEFESNETRIIFDDEQKISEIVPVVRNDAHKLIEECMILANISAAAYLEKRRMPVLYRVHSSPKADRLDDLRSFLTLRGLSLGGGDTPTPLDYANLSRQVVGRVDATIIQTVMLRSMQQAVYQPSNDGHFGLALDQYAHFTSPIRRYPDLLVHRAIEHVLKKGKVSEYRYSKDDMVGLGESCSMTERRADEATRDVTSWLKCEYMQDHVGDEFDGVVSSVTSFGLFIQLKDIFVEGLVHITSLSKDYYHFDQAAHSLVGERTGAAFGLGDSIKVRVAAVNLEDRKIDFDPVDGAGKKSTTKAGKRKSGKDFGKSKATKGRKKKVDTISDTKKSEANKPAPKKKKSKTIRKKTASSKARKKAATGKSAQGKTNERKTNERKTNEGKSSQNKTAASKTAQGKSKTRKSKASQGKSVKDKSSQDKSAQGKSAPGKEAVRGKAAQSKRQGSSKKVVRKKSPWGSSAKTTKKGGQ